MKDDATCPLCGAPSEVRDIGPFGYVAHCSNCYEADEEAPQWARMKGHAERADVAVERWFEVARECASIDEIPALPCSYRPAALWVSLQAQVDAEFQRQHGWHLVDIEMKDGLDEFDQPIWKAYRYLETECG